MSYQKIEAKGVYAEFTIEEGSIQDATASLGGDDNWDLCVINTTDFEFALASLAREGEPFGPWFRIGPVKNNCATGFDMCFAEQEWTSVLRLPSSSPFSIRIATLPNGSSVAQGAEFLGIVPASGTQGGTIGLSVDG